MCDLIRDVINYCALETAIWVRYMYIIKNNKQKHAKRIRDEMKEIFI